MLDRASRLVDLVRSAVSELGHPEHRPLIVGLSGGVDSQVLVYALRDVVAEDGPPLHVVHVDHGLRAESAQDAAAVRDLCTQLSIACDVVEADVTAWDNWLRQGTESAARAARYAALARIAIDHNADTLVTGHTLDDQVETVLLRLMSGSGLEGLSGMERVTRRPIATEPGRPARRRLRLFRPLLAVSRDEIEEYAREHGIEPIEDPSNDELNYRRNAIRHTVLPAMLEIDPSFRQAVARTSELLREDARFIRDSVDESFNDVVAERGGVWMVELQQFRMLHAAVQRRILFHAIDPKLTDSARLTQERIEALRTAAVDGDPGKTIELAERVVGYVDYDRLAIGDGETLMSDLRRLSWIPLIDPGSEAPVSGEVDIPLDNGWRVRGVAPDDGSLVLRTRRDGDRTRGPRGRRIKLQDWMVDRKVPRYVRDWVPVVASGDEVKWVIGLEITEYSDNRAGVHLQLELDTGPQVQS